MESKTSKVKSAPRGLLKRMIGVSSSTIPSVKSPSLPVSGFLPNTLIAKSLLSAAIVLLIIIATRFYNSYFRKTKSKGNAAPQHQERESSSNSRREDSADRLTLRTPLAYMRSMTSITTNSSVSGLTPMHMAASDSTPLKSKPLPPKQKVDLDSFLTRLKKSGIRVNVIKSTDRSKEKELMVNNKGELFFRSDAGVLKKMMRKPAKRWSCYALKSVIEGDQSKHCFFLEFPADDGGILHLGARSESEKIEMIESFKSLLQQVQSNPDWVQSHLTDLKEKQIKGFVHKKMVPVPVTPATPIAPPAQAAPAAPATPTLMWPMSIFSPSRKPMVPKPAGPLRDLSLKDLKELIAKNDLLVGKDFLEKSEFVAVLDKYYASFE